MKKHIITIETFDSSVKDHIENELDDCNHKYKLTSKTVEVEENTKWALDTLKEAIDDEIPSNRDDVYRALAFVTKSLKSGKKKGRG